MKIKTEGISKLKRRVEEGYRKGDKIFKEMRSNVRLTCGDHYLRSTERAINNMRAGETQMSRKYRLRLTKNHIHPITKTIINRILSHSPGVTITARNGAEIQDQKAAELSNKVWEQIKHRHNFREKVYNWVSDFVIIGEAHVKVGWDAEGGSLVKGDLIQYTDPATGEVVKQEQEMIQTGALKYERIYAFDIAIDPSAKEDHEAKWKSIRKMVDTKDLLEKFPEGDIRREYVEDSVKQTYNVFDANNGNFESSDQKKCLVYEIYFKKSGQYPNGFYYIFTDKGILYKGELDCGVFPIISIGYDDMPTSPRAASIIRQLRSYQGEINRAGSKIAEHQITLGDDTVYIQKGTKIASGGYVHGVKAVQYSGMQPNVVQGRSGAQYLEYMQSQIDEMYKVANVFEYGNKDDAGNNPWGLVQKNMKEQERFSLYGEKIERFLEAVCKASMLFYKQKCTEQGLIQDIGRDEAVNVKEFKNDTGMAELIKLEPRTEDANSRFGRMMRINHVLQFSPELPPEQKALYIKALPEGNELEATKLALRDFNTLRNVQLKLERGEDAPVRYRENHQYMAEGLTARLSEPEADTFADEIIQAYEARIQQHEQFLAQQQQEMMRLQAEQFPMGGGLVSCDLWVEVPNADGTGTKKERVKLPAQSIDELRLRLEKQGFSQETLNQMRGDVAADVARMSTGNGSQGQE